MIEALRKQARPSFAAAAALLLGTCSSSDNSATLGRPTLEIQSSGVSVRLQAVSAADEAVTWASGLGGTYVRTTDGGNTWVSGVVAGADSLQFRDVHAVDANTAYLLSAGPGEASRIYKTRDAGTTWTLQFTNREPDAFFDCMAFWDDSSGVAFSDAVEGRFIIITTTNGREWVKVPDANVPPALPGEGSFAASGTCITVFGDSTAWFGTGASERARVFKTTDRGATWTVNETPVVAGTSTSGIAAVAFRDALHGIVAGGEIDKPDQYSDNVAFTSDGGLNWTLAARPTFTGAVYGIIYVPGASGILVAVGPQGAAYSLNDGAAWGSLDTLEYWSVDFAGPSAGWMVGPEGRIARVSFWSDQT